MSCGCSPCGSGLITRGLGSPLMVTQGYGSCVTPQVSVFVQAVNLLLPGRRPYERKIRQILVAVKLLEVNTIEPDPQIVGGISRDVLDDPRTTPLTAARFVGAKVSKAVGRIGIRATHFRRKRGDD